MKRLEKFFKHPELAPQRQYEAIRAIVIDKLSFSSVAKQYNYSISTLYALMRDFKPRKFMILYGLFLIVYVSRSRFISLDNIC